MQRSGLLIVQGNAAIGQCEPSYLHVLERIKSEVVDVDTTARLSAQASALHAAAAIYRFAQPLDLPEMCHVDSVCLRNNQP